MLPASERITADIEAYLHASETKDLLRFMTCGNVDDGKSTLIGRLLFDSKLIYADQLAAIQKDSEKFNTTDQEFDLALLVDGLQSEREQGITIDVAYRYFSTKKRKYIIADTPGHEQYTRNMVTGASTCDLAIVMVDARYGIQTQTRRHSYICSLLGIKHIIVAINKMDLIEYSHDIYQQIKVDYRAMAKNLSINDIRFVPISALKGDNVVLPSTNMDWYPGGTLMKLLETVKIDKDKNLQYMRFPVQYVNRPHADFRGFSGTLASGLISVGDGITVLPSGKTSNIKSIYTYDGELNIAQPNMAITVTLEHEIDISRGDMIVHTGSEPEVSNYCQAHLVWMDESPLRPDKEYLFKFATKTSNGKVSEIQQKIDINRLELMHLGQNLAAANKVAPNKVAPNKATAEIVNSLSLNEIATVAINLSEKLVLDNYHSLPSTGCFIVIDRYTNATVGAGMVISTKSTKQQFAAQARQYNQADKDLNAYVRKHYPEWNCVEIK